MKKYDKEEKRDNMKENGGYDIEREDKAEDKRDGERVRGITWE
jgi:hypothetical protein